MNDLGIEQKKLITVKHKFLMYAQVTQSYLPRVAQPTPPEPETKTKKKSRDEAKKTSSLATDENSKTKW